MTLLAIDPGKHVGWAVFHEGVELGRGVFEFEEIHDRLSLSRFDFDEQPELSFDGQWIDSGVVENYRGRPGAKNGGQLFWGPECLATFATYCHLAGVELVRQEPGILPVAALQAGYTLPKGHLPDQDSAWLHGRYRLTQLGVLRAEPLDP